MKALRLERWQTEPVLRDVPVPEPAHDEISRCRLDEAPAAYRQLAIGALDGRAVVVPNAEYRP